MAMQALLVVIVVLAAALCKDVTAASSDPYFVNSAGVAYDVGAMGSATSDYLVDDYDEYHFNLNHDVVCDICPEGAGACQTCHG
ncbi:hypothetical protein KIPB_003049, partial [Kipferlia bialata]|eukprot:g3049.t1